MISQQVGKLHKKLERLERKYAKLPKDAKVQKMRIAKTYAATIDKIERLTGREVV